MNKKTTLILLSLLAVAIITGCGTSRFGSKHYKNRDWVYVGKNTEEKITTEAKAEQCQQNKIENESDRVEQVELKKTGVRCEANNELKQAFAENTDFSEKPDNVVYGEEPDMNEGVGSVKPTTDVNNKHILSQPDVDEDVLFILMIIFAFFIPPLAVYLKEGASSMFWITLILCLLAGGLGFGIYGGLWGLWGVAVVLALLRVLDII